MCSSAPAVCTPRWFVSATSCFMAIRPRAPTLGGFSAVVAFVRSEVPAGDVPRLDAVGRDPWPPRRVGQPTCAASTCSATSCRRCCCGSSAGTNPRAGSSPPPTMPRSSCTAASWTRSSATSPATTTPCTTPTRSVPQSVLSRALARVTGRSTKELITDRRMLEASRLLRFTDMTVGEVAFRAASRTSCTSRVPSSGTAATRRRLTANACAATERSPRPPESASGQNIHTSAQGVHSVTGLAARH